MTAFLFAYAWTISWTACRFVGWWHYASVLEWFLHKDVMHKPVGSFKYPYEAHTKVHHHIFKYDKTYHLQNREDEKTITMAWWNGPVLVFIATLLLPFFLSWIFGNWWLCLEAAVTVGIYYGAYEYMHFCMHKPREEQLRLIEKSWIFYKLNGHHLLHHRYMNRNFNVVYPFMDLCMGTLLLRSKIAFPQARGPRVPDVQPKTNRK